MLLVSTVCHSTKISSTGSFIETDIFLQIDSFHECAMLIHTNKIFLDLKKRDKCSSRKLLLLKSLFPQHFYSILQYNTAPPPTNKLHVLALLSWYGTRQSGGIPTCQSFTVKPRLVFSLLQYSWSVPFVSPLSKLLGHFRLDYQGFAKALP